MDEAKADTGYIILVRIIINRNLGRRKKGEREKSGR
jgi:hypothetical protein